jgi:hypothetical protein
MQFSIIFPFRKTFRLWIICYNSPNFYKIKKNKCFAAEGKMLLQEELKRYNRQIMMDKWGEDVQRKLKNSTIFIAGAGGLGSPVSIYLAAAGIGNIRICDFDSPDWTNLNRQRSPKGDRLLFDLPPVYNINCYKAFKKNGLEVSILYPFYRLIPKLKQFFRAPFKGRN